MRKINLTEKLILYFLVIGVFTIVTISWYAYQSGRKAIINRTFDQLMSVRIVKQNLVEKYFSDRFHELQLYTASKGIQQVLHFIDKQDHIPTIDKVTEIIKNDDYLTESFLENPDVQAIYLTIGTMSYRIGKTNSQLKIQEIHTHLLDNKNINKSNGDKFFIQEIRIRSSNQFSLLISSKTLNSYKQGLCGIEINLSPINTIMIENDPNSGWGKSGESYLVGDDHLMKTPSRFITPSVQKTVVVTTAVMDGLSGHAGTTILKDYRNIDVLSSYSKLNINGLNWVILAEIDLGEAMAPVNALRNEILFLSIFITSVVFLLALLLARSISGPVRRLTQAAEDIRKGDYNVNISVSHEDEIGRLTQAFNDMALQIRQQSRARIDGQDMERQRLSRELHDGLGQWLAAARFRLESTDCARPEVTIQNINETKRLVDNIIDEIRRISNNLMPGVLQEIGLESALYAMARELSREDVLKVLLTIKTPLDSLATDYQLYVFRIIQEALNNVVKHSKASEVNVEIQQIDATISLNIKDNGVGFSEEEAKVVKGNGLINMRERTHLLGGEMIISSNPSSGTLLTFTLPLTHLS